LLVMRFLLSTLAIFVAAPLHGQQLTSRESTMKNLQDLLAQQQRVNWVQTPTDSGHAAESTKVVATLAAVNVDSSACKLTFKDGRVYPDQHYESVQTWSVRIPGIERVRVDSLEGFVDRVRAEGGHPGWATKTSPTVFVLQMFAAPKQPFDVHRWSKNGSNDPIERDLQQSLAFIVFADESAARETAKALEKAMDLCTH
jgi:hypothetical protein